MTEGPIEAPDSTAVRVALWRAMHVQVDPPPHVLDDEIGLRLAAPDDGWRRRPDMDPASRAGSGHPSWPVPASSRIWSSSRPGGASASTSSSEPASTPSPSARPEIASRLRVFEVDQPGPQAWKRRRLIELGFGVPEWLRLVPVDFEAGDAWWETLAAAGFDAGQPAVVASTGVSMYLTREAIAATLRAGSHRSPPARRWP